MLVVQQPLDRGILWCPCKMHDAVYIGFNTVVACSFAVYRISRRLSRRDGGYGKVRKSVVGCLPCPTSAPPAP